MSGSIYNFKSTTVSGKQRLQYNDHLLNGLYYDCYSNIVYIANA